MKNSLLEICCYSVQSAINAEIAGADRIELCAGVHEGGTTPSAACIKQTIELVKIPVHVIIRPRGADFCYSDLEFDCMLKDIEHCKEMGVQGIVSGVLLADGEIDCVRTKQLLEASDSINFTFHRAFDMVKDQMKALDELIELGVDRILTSGGEQVALKGSETIKILIEKAADRLVVMPGSGISEENIDLLRTKTKAKEFHCSAKVLKKGKMQYKNPQIAMGGEESVPEFEFFEADCNKIRKIVSILKAED